EAGRMEGLAPEASDQGGKRIGQPGRLGGEMSAIDAVANQRMADISHMNANLVGSSGLQPALEQRRDAEILGEAIMGQRIARIRAVRGDDAASGPVTAGPAERRTDRAGGAFRPLPYQGEIGTTETAATPM